MQDRSSGGKPPMTEIQGMVVTFELGLIVGILLFIARKIGK
jgi:hypothetical protein